MGKSYGGVWYMGSLANNSVEKYSFNDALVSNYGLCCHICYIAKSSNIAFSYRASFAQLCFILLV